jgi:hypothetical protein
VKNTKQINDTIAKANCQIDLPVIFYLPTYHFLKANLLQFLLRNKGYLIKGLKGKDAPKLLIHASFNKFNKLI